MTKRAVRAEDIFAIRLLGDVAKHPTASQILATITELDEKENTYRSHIWSVSADGGPLRLYTNGPKSESQPQWSPDGRWLAFLSNRVGDVNQVYVMPAEGGEAVQVTALSEGVSNYGWAPDSQRIAVIAEVDIKKQDVTKSAESGGERPKETPREKYTKDVRRIDKSFYRMDGVGFFGDKRDQLHVVSLFALTAGTYQAAKSEVDVQKQFRCVRLTFGNFEIDNFDWSPAGTAIVVSTNVNEDAERTFKQYLYAVPVPDLSVDAQLGPVAVAEMPCLTPGIHFAGTMKWSPDGAQIAFRGENHQHGPTTMTGLYLLDVASGDVRWLTEGTDALFANSSITDTRTSVGDGLAWAPDGSAVYSTMSQRGTVQLVAVDAKTGAVSALTDGACCVIGYSFDRAGETVALNVGTGLDVGNVYALNLAATEVGARGTGPGTADPFAATGAGRKLTDINTSFYETVALCTPQRFAFESDGLALDGWVVLPNTPAPAGGYPAVIEVHGGPAAMYSESFFFEFQLLAASGLAVVFTNPRGGLGYGQEFVSCIEMDWGNLDFKDVEAGMDAALEQFPLNPVQVAIAGGSYGGFMAAWAIGHTKRYKAAIVMRGVINWYSMMASDVGFVTPAEEFQGVAPWDDPQRYMRISPITYANEMDAHTLIIHSENDYRCPIDQGEQLYIALRLRGVPVEFLRFPNESHGLSRNGQPWHRLVRLEAIQSFLAKELLGVPAE